jgi:hypothetical protein
MSVVDKKKDVLGKIAAARTIADKVSKINLKSLTSSFNNNNGDVISFLTEMIKTLIGYEALVGTLVDTLTYKMIDIEKEVKKALKKSLKDIVSCGVDPTIPTFLKSTGDGIIIEVNKIDFMDIFKIDPNSPSGKLVYTDVTPILTNSNDFNTFMYGVIQGDGTTYTWKGIYEVTFKSLGSGSRPNNTFTIKSSPTYSSAPKTLTDLNNDFIDSLSLFNSTDILNKIVDIMFGSFSVSVNKTSKQLEMEAKINNVIDCIVSADGDDIIDDNYFTFTNSEVYVHQEQASFRKKGIKKLECCNKVAASIPVSFLTDFTDEMATAGTEIEQKIVISSNLNKMAQQNTVNSDNPSDHISIKLNFVQNIIEHLIKGIIGMVITPKVIMPFLINFKIIYGISSEIKDPIDFIKKNKNLFTGLINSVKSLIISVLKPIVMRQVVVIASLAKYEKVKEQTKSAKAQLASLIGVKEDQYEKLSKKFDEVSSKVLEILPKT